jgi:hypothetical protein
MTLTNLRKKDTIRTSINYCCVPGKQEPLQGASRPAFAGLADTCTPWHRPPGQVCSRCKCLQDPPHKPMHFVQGVLVARIQDLCS